MQNVKFIDFLKLRASWGIINLDYIPAEGYWNQKFTGGNIYIIGKDNNNTLQMVGKKVACLLLM